MASMPTIGKDREASPDSVGIGKKVRWGGSVWPDRMMPKGGRPRSKRRRMQAGIILAEDMEL